MMCTQGDKGVSFMLNRVHARANNADKPLTDAFKEVRRPPGMPILACVLVGRGISANMLAWSLLQIAAMCEALGIMGRAKDAANKIYKEIIYDQQALKGRSTKARPDLGDAAGSLGC